MYITEAINELDDGKYIRRDTWLNTNYYLYKQGTHIYSVFSAIRESYENDYVFEVADLRGNDWVCIDSKTTILTDNDTPTINKSICIKCGSKQITNRWVKKDRYIKVNGLKSNAKHESMLCTCTNCKYEWLNELSD